MKEFVLKKKKDFKNYKDKNDHKPNTEKITAFMIPTYSILSQNLNKLQNTFSM